MDESIKKFELEEIETKKLLISKFYPNYKIFDFDYFLENTIPYFENNVRNLSLKEINETLLNLLKKLILSNKKIIDNYLQKNDLNKLTPIAIVKKIVNLIKIFDFSIEDYYCLFDNNEIFNSIVNKVLKTTTKVLLLTDDEYTISLLEAFCIKNNIEIEDISSIEKKQLCQEYNSDVYSLIKNTKVLDKNEEINLFKEYHKGNFECKGLIIEYNLRLVLKIASYYSYKTKINFDDLFQEGTLGLIKSIDRYDENKNYKFSTYSTWYIKKYILKYILENNTVYIPRNVMSDINRFKKLYATGNYTIEEISEIMDISISTAKNFYIMSQSPISMEESIIDNEESCCLKNVIKDPKFDTENQALTRVQREEILKIISLLDPIQKEIIMLRFGFVGDRIYKYDEIGQALGFTGERARQILKKSLKKLKYILKSENFQLMLNDFSEEKKENLESKTLNNNDKTSKSKIDKTIDNYIINKLSNIKNKLTSKKFMDISEVLLSDEIDVLYKIVKCDIAKKCVKYLSNDEQFIISFIYGYYDENYYDYMYLKNKFNINLVEVNNSIINFITKIILYIKRKNAIVEKFSEYIDISTDKQLV